jgi:hypothetical protein
VLLTGPIDAPIVRDTAVIDLSDPKVPGSKQPHHDGMGRARKQGLALERLVASVEIYSQRSLSALLSKYVNAGYYLSGAGIVVGSDCDPTTIANPHIRIHAFEGRLFRRVIEQALARGGVSSSTFIERTLFAQAARLLDRPQEQLKQAVLQLRPDAAGRWRAEGKAAALAAWLRLAS